MNLEFNQVGGQSKDNFQHETSQKFYVQTWTRCIKKKLFTVIFHHNAKSTEDGMAVKKHWQLNETQRVKEETTQKVKIMANSLSKFE